MPELIGHGNKFIANLSGYYDNEDKYNFDRLLLLDNYEKSLDIYPPAIFSISADTNGKHIIVSSGYFLKMGNHGITRYDYNDGNIKNLFKFYSKIILWQRYAAWLRAYRPCIHSQW